jgi:hypothetical protein
MPAESKAPAPPSALDAVLENEARKEFIGEQRGSRSIGSVPKIRLARDIQDRAPR